MNLRIVAIFAIVLGLVLVSLGFWQLNQYMNNAGLSGQVSQLSALSTGADASASASYAQSLQNAYSAALNAMVAPMALDFILGAILALIGLAIYPKD